MKAALRTDTDRLLIIMILGYSRAALPIATHRLNNIKGGTVGQLCLHTDRLFNNNNNKGDFWSACLLYMVGAQGTLQ